MVQMKTCKEVAAAWGVSYRTVNNLCKEGTIPGAEKIKVPGRFLMMQSDWQMDAFPAENI